MSSSLWNLHAAPPPTLRPKATDPPPPQRGGLRTKRALPVRGEPLRRDVGPYSVFDFRSYEFSPRHILAEINRLYGWQGFELERIVVNYAPVNGAYVHTITALQGRVDVGDQDEKRAVRRAVLKWILSKGVALAPGVATSFISVVAAEDGDIETRPFSVPPDEWAVEGNDKLYDATLAASSAKRHREMADLRVEALKQPPDQELANAESALAEAQRRRALLKHQLAELQARPVGLAGPVGEDAD